MNNKLSLLLLSFILMSSSPAFADTVSEDTNDDAMSEVSLEMTAEELQEVKDICISIADESGLENDAHSEYVEECVAAETMVLDDPEASMDDLEEAPLEDEDMTNDDDTMVDTTDS